MYVLAAEEGSRNVIELCRDAAGAQSKSQIPPGHICCAHSTECPANKSYLDGTGTAITQLTSHHSRQMMSRSH